MKKIIITLLIAIAMVAVPATAMAGPTEWAVSEAEDALITWESENDYTPDEARGNELTDEQMDARIDAVLDAYELVMQKANNYGYANSEAVQDDEKGMLEMFIERGITDFETMDRIIAATY